MSPTRIHAIKKIGNYRIFQNWRPSDGVEFERVNLIYGQNGSGKSTFASLFQGCADYNSDHSTDSDGCRAEIARAGLQLDAYGGSGSLASGVPAISLDDRAFWGRVRVFDRDFIRRNLRFEEPDGPHPQVLLTLGERLADAEEKIEELEPKLRTVRQDLDAAKEDLERAQKKIGDLSTKIAREIGSYLAGTPGFNVRSYNRTKVQKLLDKFEGDPIILADASTDVLADRKRATRHAMQPVRIQQRGELLEQAGVDEARQLLTTSVVSNRLIEGLVGRSDRSRWVQEGISLHKALEECLFCGQGLTSDRRDALNAHFDESFKMLQGAVDDLVKRLEGSVEVSKTFLDDFPDGSEVYEDLREDLRKARQDYVAEHESYARMVGEIVAALNEKKNNPFGASLPMSDLALVAPSVAALEKVVTDHRNKIDRHEEEAKKAATRVEHYYVKSAADEYASLKNEIEGAQAACSEFQTQVKGLEEQIAELKNVEGDPVPGARELAEELRGLLGRDELRFSAQGSNHYLIERGGSPAKHLSEGEQTAIALLYFLHSVREDKIEGEPPIVIIDDPVSSLDHAILFGASAHVWEELVANTYASQVFLLTHNFELFRQWLIQMERVPKKSREGGYAVFRVRVRLDRSAGRVPEFEVWDLDDKRRKKLRSQYHFLFDQVAATLAESDADLDSIAQMEAAALVPNTARKLLEGFLSFRSPSNMGDLRESVRAALEKRPGLDVSVRTMVVRYAHANSHLEEADLTKPLDPSEAVSFLRALFTFMEHVDEDHFRSMCKALGYERGRLLGASSVPEGAVS